MKKITLPFLMCLCLAFSLETFSQVLNQNASWPNGSWTITGTYSTATGAFEANPTVDSNFAYDDDDAGNPSNDNIAAESPTIDLTAAFTAGEVWLTVTADYVYYYLADDELVFQYWDADGGSWVNWGPSFDTLGTTTSLTDDFCSGTPSTYLSPELDISGFSATQLSGFRYRIAYDDNPAGGDWNYGFCFQSPTIISSTPPTDVLDYYNLQYPAAGTIGAGDTYNVYAQAYEMGLTDVTTGQAPGIEAWIGYSLNDTDPSGTGWTWIPAEFNTEVGNNDEYVLNLANNVNALGTYYYASRWRLNGGIYTFGGIQADGSYGGIWGEDNNISGVLTVNEPSNDECSGAVMLTVNSDFSCGVVTSGTTLGATASPQPDDATGTPNNDVWFSFVATGTAHQIVISNVVNLGGGTSTSTDMGMSVFNDLAGCNMVAANEVGESDPNTLNLTGLTAGNTYYVRVYGWGSTIQNNNFNICVGTPPPAPDNDECANAVDLTVNADLACGTVTAGTTVSATQSAQADDVSGTPNNDVWFSFTATNTAHRVSLIDVVAVSGTATDMGMGVYDGTGGCDALVFTATSDPNVLNLTGLTAGTVYYVRVYGWASGSTTAQTNFNICVGTPPPPPANDDCAGAIPFTIENSCNITTISTLDATEGANELNSCDASGNFGVWYSFVGPDNGNLEFESGAGSPGILIYSGADCGSLTEVSGTCFNNASGSITGLNPGENYYAMIWTDTATATVEFCLYSLECAPAVATASIGTTDCDTNNTYSVDVDITDLGTSSTLVISNDAGLADQSVTATGVVTLGPIPVGTPITITLENTSDPACDLVLSTINYNCPPANDDCSDAIELIPGGVYEENAIDGTVLGATADAEDVDTCGEPGPGVWYSLVVPADGAISIETGPDAGSGATSFDSVIEVFSGSCGALTSIDCDDDGAATDNFSLLNLTGLTPGSTIYIRVWEYGGDESEPFSISAYNATLSVEDADFNAFTYFPNPVKDILTLKSQSNIQNVSIYNMLGQEVLRTAPNDVTSEISMSDLQTGAYFVKVTINDKTETIRVIKQ